MLRVLAVLGILAIVGAAVYGAAAGLDVFAGTIQGGTDNTVSCDTDGIEVVAYGLNTYPEDEGVEYITVKGVAAACNGARIMGRLYTPGFLAGDYLYTSGAGAYGPQSNVFVIANGDSNTLYTLYLKNRAFNTQVWVPAEFIQEVKLWVEGDTTP